MPGLPPPPVLDAGGGVVLRAGRPDRADEVEAVLEQHRDPQVQRFTWIPEVYERVNAEAFLANAERGWRDGDLATLVVDVGGAYRGTVDLRPEPGAWAEVGFGLHPAARGRGVASRAVSALLDWGFAELGLAGVTWRADVANTASLGVARRCGFTVEGRVRGLLVHRGARVDGVVATRLHGDQRPGAAPCSPTGKRLEPDPSTCQRGRMTTAEQQGAGGGPVRPEHPVLDAGGGVRLRPHRDEDLPAVVEQGRDAGSARFTTVPVPYEDHHARDFLDQLARGWADGTTAGFAVDVDGGFAGTVDLRLGEGGWAELGFGLHPAARGRGVMTRAARTLLAWGFEELGLQGVHWRAVVGNHASRRVAEKCGFRVEGQVRGLLVHREERLDGWIGSLLPGELR